MVPIRGAFDHEARKKRQSFGANAVKLRRMKQFSPAADGNIDPRGEKMRGENRFRKL